MYDRLNPIKSVRQGAKRVKIPDLLSIEEMCSILCNISFFGNTNLGMVAAVTGLRRSEIRGLKWGDIDREALWLSLGRGKASRSAEAPSGFASAPNSTPNSSAAEPGATLVAWLRRSQNP